MHRFLLLFALALGLFSAGAASAETPTLTIYTYNSFTSDWGPGPAVKKAFEATAPAGSTGSRRGWRPRCSAGCGWRGASTKADVVLGLDTNLTAEAAATGLFAPHALDLSALKLPIAWTDQDVRAVRLRLFRVRLRQDQAAEPAEEPEAELVGRRAERRRS